MFTPHCPADRLQRDAFVGFVDSIARKAWARLRAGVMRCNDFPLIEHGATFLRVGRHGLGKIADYLLQVFFFDHDIDLGLVVRVELRLVVIHINTSA